MNRRLLARRGTVFARKIAKATSGMAVLEFALALPFLMVTILGGIELVVLALTHQQVSRVATSSADLAARFRLSVDETDIKTLMLGARLSTDYIKFDEHGWLIVSSVTKNAGVNPNHTVRWQRCEGSTTAKKPSKLGVEGKTDVVAADSGMAVTPGNNVLFAEAFYNYTPEFAPWLVNARTISYRSAYITRANCH